MRCIHIKHPVVGRLSRRLLPILVLLVYIFAASAQTSAMTFLDLGEINDQHSWYSKKSTVSGSCSVSSGSSSTTLTGSDNETKGWNYFKGKGLDDIHAAAVIGNFMTESSLNPTIMQIGGNSNDPNAAGVLGWGIAQWSGNNYPTGQKVDTLFKQAGVTEPYYELATQLDVVWYEMNNVTPTGFQNLLAGFNQQATLVAATSFFQQNFEGGAGADVRQQDAQEAFTKYGGSPSAAGGTTSSTSSSSGCATGSLSPDCQSAVGNAKIICAAKQYDTASYSEEIAAGHQGGAAWHATCPIIGPSCILDCSGLVNIAVYDAFGVDLKENTWTEVSDTKDWKEIPFNQLAPGDLIQPNTGHVEIVDHVSGSTIFTFGAHQPGVPQPDQVNATSYENSPDYVFLRYIGPGSSS